MAPEDSINGTDSEESIYFEAEDDEDEMVSIGHKIVFNPSDRRIRDLYTDWQEGLLDPTPDFQRGYVWDDKKASLLVDSILLNVPIPLIYTAEDQDQTELVIDGHQRLMSLFRYMNNEFPLKGVKTFKNLEGKYFRDLEREYQMKIRTYPLPIITIKAESDEEVKFEIFERINSGSVNLNEQELRNCIYRGAYNEFLKQCAEEDLLLRLVFGGNKPKRMQDVEMVLRFFSFYEDQNLYPGRLKAFLNEHMKQRQQAYEIMEITEREKKFDNLKKVYKKALELSSYVFGDEAFRPYSFNNEKELAWTSKVNRSLYDVVMCGFALYEKSQVVPKLDSIRESMINIILKDPKFLPNAGTLQQEVVRYKFTTWFHELQLIIDSPKQPRSFSSQLKQELFDKDSTCSICHQSIKSIDDAEIDHHEPYWRGGATIPENARLSHRFCNRSKSGN